MKKKLIRRVIIVLINLLFGAGCGVPLDVSVERDGWQVHLKTQVGRTDHESERGGVVPPVAIAMLNEAL
jgi:hypothetical protein